MGEQSEEVAGVPFYHLPTSCCSQICRILGAGGRKEAETTGAVVLGCRCKSLAAKAIGDRLGPTTEAETAGAGASVRRRSPRVSGAGVSCSCRGSLIAVAAELRCRWKG